MACVVKFFDHGFVLKLRPLSAFPPRTLVSDWQSHRRGHPMELPPLPRRGKLAALISPESLRLVITIAISGNRDAIP